MFFFFFFKSLTGLVSGGLLLGELVWQFFSVCEMMMMTTTEDAGGGRLGVIADSAKGLEG
jgi:hypothetical protein